METASCVKSVIMAANQYKINRSDSNMIYFQRQLEVLTGITARGSSLKFFSPKNILLTECLTAIIDILAEPTKTKPSLLLKCILLTQNLVAEKEIREALHESFHVTPSLAAIVKLHGASAGDSLTLECLHLLQKVTYGHKINFQENYVEDLLKFVIRNIHGPENEFTQHCLGLLVNLSRDNFAIQSYIKNMENARSLYKTLMTYISGENLTVIVFSLSIITSLWLHEDLGNKMFNSTNINQIFQTVFNIILRGDSGITRRYAVDLFKELLKDPKIQRSLLAFNRLSPCIENILNLISSSTAESVVMVFELLLAFCTVEGARATICKCIMSNAILTDRGRFSEMLKLSVSQVKEPLFSSVHWASQSTESHDVSPLFALDFLTEFYEELIYSNTRVQYSAHADLILPVVIQTLTSNIDGEAGVQKKKCLKFVKAIQLLIVLSGEDDVKRKMASVLDMTLFSKILEYQFANNHVGLCSKKFTSPVDNWSYTGVEIVIFCLDLMSKLQKSNPEVDALFCSLLQDSRIVPFLAAGVTSDDRTVVQVTFHLFTIGLCLEGFPTVLLGDAVAGFNAKKTETAQKASTVSNPILVYGTHMNGHDSLEMSSYRTDHSNATSVPNTDHDASVQSIIEKMQTGFEVKDMKQSEIIDIYEHKLQSLQTKEDHLQDLLQAKALALAQADRLIAQYRSRRANYEAEAHKIRSLLQESEKRAEQLREQLNEITLQKEKLNNELEQLHQENQKLEQVAEEHQQLTTAYTELTERFESSEKSLLSLRQEHKTLSEMHEMLQKHNESLKHQHDVASEQLSKLQDERKTLSKQLKEKDSKLQDITKTHTKLEKEYQKTDKEKNELEECIDKLRDNLSKTEQAKKQLQHQVSSLDMVCKQHETDISAKDEQILHLRTELEKHTQIAALIHSLSSGKQENVDKMKL